MKELLEKKAFLQNSLRLCEVEIVKNLIGKRVASETYGVAIVLSVELNEKYPGYSNVLFVTTKGHNRVKDMYKNLRVFNE